MPVIKTDTYGAFKWGKIIAYFIASFFLSIYLLDDKLIRPLNLLNQIKTSNADVFPDFVAHKSSQRGIETSSCTISYGFSVDGIKYRGISEIEGDPKYNPIPKTITIQYNGSDPSVNGYNLTYNVYFDIAFYSIFILNMILSIRIFALNLFRLPNKSIV